MLGRHGRGYQSRASCPGAFEKEASKETDIALSLVNILFDIFDARFRINLQLPSAFP